MDAHVLLLEALDSRRRQHRKRSRDCRRDFSAGAVHRLRVATRRLLALADLLRAVAPQAKLKKIRKALKKQLHGFDDLRDIQVMRADISRKRACPSALNPFRDDLRRRERRLARASRDFVETLNPGALSKRLKKVRKTLVEEEADADVNARVLQAADDAYQSALRRFRRVDPAQPATFHRLRVAFKRFRYTLEIVRPLLRAIPESGLARMRDYQATLGAIQDAEVFLRALTAFAKRTGTPAPASIVRQYERRLAERIAAYAKEKGEILTFWRSRPDHPFPWEPKT